MRAFIPFMTLLLTTSLMAQTKKIIFVCDHGAAKSVIAAAYFNKLAKERNLNYVAECRGTDPDSAVSIATKAGLTADNLFDPNVTPQKLSGEDTVNVDRFILFTTSPPQLENDVPFENWSNTQNLDADYARRRDAIIRKINELLDRLAVQK